LAVLLRDLHHEVVRDQRAALCHDRSPIVHLALYSTGHLDRLQLGLESTGEGPFDHALKPSLEALNDAHGHLPSPLLDDRIGAKVRSAYLVPNHCSRRASLFTHPEADAHPGRVAEWQ